MVDPAVNIPVSGLEIYLPDSPDSGLRRLVAGGLLVLEAVEDEVPQRQVEHLPGSLACKVPELQTSPESEY